MQIIEIWSVHNNSYTYPAYSYYSSWEGAMASVDCKDKQQVFKLKALLDGEDCWLLSTQVDLDQKKKRKIEKIKEQAKKKLTKEEIEALGI